MNRSTPGLPVHRQLPEFTQTHAHQVGDAIQPSHSLSSPSPPAPNPSQHQGLLATLGLKKFIAPNLPLRQHLRPLEAQCFQLSHHKSFLETVSRLLLPGLAQAIPFPSDFLWRVTRFQLCFSPGSDTMMGSWLQTDLWAKWPHLLSH